jgi:hypothetical protein
VSVSLVGVIGGASWGLVVGSRVAESALVDGPCGGRAVVGVGRGAGLVLGGLVVAALVVILAGVMKVAVVVGWCRSGSWERGWWWRDQWWRD